MRREALLAHKIILPAMKYAAMVGTIWRKTVKKKDSKSLEESVVAAMDGTDPEIYPYLPYILQDVWEMGASPEVMVRLARRHAPQHRELAVIDLGCGKGAVSVALARMLPCRCLGIDAIDAFIEEARQKALAFGVADRCSFTTGDIREWVERRQVGKGLSRSKVPAATTAPKFDLIVLGAIGPVLGDYFETLTRLSSCLAHDGIILIDDGYIPDGSTFTHPLIQRKNEIDRQIVRAGMKLVDKEVIGTDDMQASNKAIHQPLIRRCRELMEKHPEQHHLFEGYIRKQEEEIDILENRIVCSTMVVKR
ncbi:MAG: class I SAM-dependent methyltransferase [Balneolaceae bacterium]|nr:MAG: class I SAM-dependent methyltransferase [Balneolaceae bacterium]